MSWLHRTGLRAAFHLLLAATLLQAAGAAQAASCFFWHRLVFAEGNEACLTDYRFAEVEPAGTGLPVAALAPSSGLYALAAPAGRGAGRSAGCPAVVGFSRDATATPAQRQAEALRLCTAALESAGAAGCSCEPAVLDGQALAPRQRFEERFEPALVAGSAEQLRQLQEQVRQLEEARQQRAAAATVAAAQLVQRPQPPAAAVARLSARALVIGNAGYTGVTPLANPRHDANAIAAKLRSFGIEVDLLLDASREDMLRAVAEHAHRARGRDVSILFYAGHGIQVDGQNYLLPVDLRAEGATVGYVKLASVSLDAVLDQLPGRTRLVFLDACRDNPLSRSLRATRGGSPGGLAPMDAASGTLVSYATRDGATADDGDGANSPYTTALLRHLDAPADIALVLRQVRQTVLRLTGGRQEPWEYGSLVGGSVVLPLMARTP